jgi:hypothetical protein
LKENQTSFGGSDTREIHRNPTVESRESVEARYYSSPNVEFDNPLDALFTDRYLSHYPHHSGKGVVVAIEIRKGDVFEFAHKDGRWEFVGVEAHQPDLLLFEPANSVAKESLIGSREYATYYVTDFTFKLSGVCNKGSNRRIDPDE